MTPTHYIHRMPFGAQLERGGVRFRLWAPSARNVMLCLEGEELPMSAEDDGWFALVVANAGPGSRYQFRIDGGVRVPDPASRSNPEDVHAPSEVVDPESFAWNDGAWRGRPWEEAVIYELHVGTFSPEGSFAGVEARLDYLAGLGVTAIELMPIADFPGRRNWGYDGVLMFAPDSAYGRPDDLKRLVQAAHACGLMVLLDVVYNHFGPEGNYLHLYAAPFFTTDSHTPWGQAINFDGDDSRNVRDFFIHNALYWLEEYHLDGLRLDAIHAIGGRLTRDIVEELAEAVRQGPGREREIHLVLENDGNEARYFVRDESGAPRRATAQWNDDLHHSLHVLLTGEEQAYYSDYADDPVRHLGRCLTRGFAYQGEMSPYRQGTRRGEPSRLLPPSAFVGFLQNHDQVGNRAFGERLSHLAEPSAVEAAMAVVLLAPSPPMLFMGEEFAAAQPFNFFCDFGPDLAAVVCDGRRNEFAQYLSSFSIGAPPEIPDPNAVSTFAGCVLDWGALVEPDYARRLAFTRGLLAVRRQQLMPRLRRADSRSEQRGCHRGGEASATYERFGERALAVRWRLGDGSLLILLANFGSRPVAVPAPEQATTLHRSANLPAADLVSGRLPPWSVAWLLIDEPGEDKGDE